MKALLVRVGADLSDGGGNWNAPVDGLTREFAYVAIPEEETPRPGHARPYGLTTGAVGLFGTSLPPKLVGANMHLDPDFVHLTYGDQGQGAKQTHPKLSRGDLLVFYGGFADVGPAPRLVYALIGLYVIDRIVLATSVPSSDWDLNAHTRRVLPPGADDIVVHAQPRVSGRLERCIPIGSYRSPVHAPLKRPCYRVDSPVLAAWGGLSVSDGYIQRSARLPEFVDPHRFYRWFHGQAPTLLQRNN